MNNSNIDPVEFNKYMLAKNTYLKLYEHGCYLGTEVTLTSDEIVALMDLFDKNKTQGFLL